MRYSIREIFDRVMLKVRLDRRTSRIYELVISVVAWVWRRFLFRTTFIAITGSMGKTTAKDALALILSSQAPTMSTVDNDNNRIGLPRTVLRVRPWHHFAVVEVGVAKPDTMKRLASIARPDVAVVLSVQVSHTMGFSSLEAIAAEKSELVAALRKEGHAVLNGDDPRVLGMARRCKGIVHTFGWSPKYEVWGDRISSRWPERLSLRLHSGGESQRAETRLVGEHWAQSVLAATAAARVCGMELKDIAASLASLEPHLSRMQPVPLPVGAVMLRDEYSACPDSFQAAMRVLGQATAKRRIAVAGAISDFGHRRKTFKHIGREVAAVAEVAVFVGEQSHHGRKAAILAGMPEESAYSFETLRECADFLKSELRAGDLILLKSRTNDHLSRVYFAQIGIIKCWMGTCPQTYTCDVCRNLGFTPNPTP